MSSLKQELTPLFNDRFDRDPNAFDKSKELLDEVFSEQDEEDVRQYEIERERSVSEYIQERITAEKLAHFIESSSEMISDLSFPYSKILGAAAERNVAALILRDLRWSQGQRTFEVSKEDANEISFRVKAGFSLYTGTVTFRKSP